MTSSLTIQHSNHCSIEHLQVSSNVHGNDRSACEKIRTFSRVNTTARDPYLNTILVCHTLISLLADPQCRPVMGSRTFHASAQWNGIDCHSLYFLPSTSS